MIIDSRNNNIKTVVLFLNLQKEFDIVNRDISIDKLNRMGIRRKANLLIKKLSDQ